MNVRQATLAAAFSALLLLLLRPKDLRFKLSAEELLLRDSFYAERLSAACNDPDAELYYADWQRPSIKGQVLDVTLTVRRRLMSPYCKKDEPRAAFVVATAADSSHYAESRDLVRSVASCFPGTLLIYWDMGLSPDELKDLSRYDHVRVARFDFTSFPKFVSFKSEYRWKPLIIHGTFDKDIAGFKPNHVFWADASVRFLCDSARVIGPLARLWRFKSFPSAFESLVKRADKDGIVFFAGGTRANYPYIHASMKKHLPMDDKRSQRSGQFCAAAMMLSADHIGHLLFWWVMCAVDSTCMLDKSTDSSVKWYSGDPEVSLGGDMHVPCPVYLGSTVKLPCSRTDQSAVNILAWNYIKKVEREDGICLLFRWPTNLFSEPSRAQQSGGLRSRLLK
ncbi:MAG: uncharacterized protein KVP18_004809 [Porospora cf. gigantea A]|uniref:uncharacterized protein n=1 Tax=Porospora cf. gigantea A TaxID=2853593 RepID=UPI00355A8555|nr:MAG: hypothetical protein KVP18_004809 [Porospora cf. gigantea A]